MIPVLKHANNRLTVSTELHQWIARRSPGASPWRNSQFASASVPWSSAEYGTTFSPEIIAGFWGLRDADSRRIWPRFIGVSLCEANGLCRIDLANIRIEIQV